MKVNRSINHIISSRIFRRIFVFTILAIYLPESVTSWKNIQKLVGLDEESCVRSCASATQCSRWSFYPSVEIADSGGILQNLCFLESKLMIEMEKHLPTVIESEKSAHKISGLKSIGPERGFVGVQKLLAGPVAFDSTTLLNFPQNFVRGCSYTISLWVWMWKPNRLRNNRLNHRREESIIISAKHVDSNFVGPEYDALLPAIIYNVRSKPGKFFFSGSRDENGDFSGFSPPFDVKYHEWMHIALTATNDEIGAYFNGKHYQASRLVPSKKGQQKCPYYSYNSGDTGTQAGYYNNDSIKIIKDSTAFNTVLEVVGGQDFSSDSGMIQDLTVLRGLALSEAHIQDMMNVRRPTVPPTLKKLMKLYGVYSLEDYCVLDWENNYYRMVEWGVCPTQVCGYVCFEERFLLGLNGVNRYHNSETSGGEGDSNPYYFDKLLDDLYTDPYQQGPLGVSPNKGTGQGGKPPRFGDQNNGEEFSDSASSGHDEGYGNYDDYYDEAGNLKPLTPEQKELLESYGYDTSDDYIGGYNDAQFDENGVGYGGRDGYGDGAGDRDGFGYGDRDEVGDGVGYGDDYDDILRRDFAALRPLPRDANNRKHTKNNKISNSKLKFKSNPTSKVAQSDQARKVIEDIENLDNPETDSTDHITKVQKSGRIKIDRNENMISEKRNSTGKLTQVPPAIVLPRRRSFRKMTKISKTRDFQGKKTSLAERDPGSISERFGFLDWLTPGVVMNYLSNAYKDFHNEQKEGTTDTDSDSDVTADRKKNEKDIDIEKDLMDKLNLLDVEEESYLLHHPVGRVQALYDAAMIWLNGRHEQFTEDLSSDALIRESEGFWTRYRERAVERATSALTLALWMADDLRTGLDSDYDWGFSYASELSLPLQAVLGYLKANGKGLTVNGIDRAEKVLRSALGGSSLTDLLSRVPYTHPKCSGIDGKEIDCSAIPMDSIGDRSSSLENGKGTVASQGRDLYWHDYYASLESDGLWTEYLNDLRPSPADINTNTDTGTGTGTGESAISEQLHRRSLLADLVENDLLKRPGSSRDDPRSKSWVVNYREPSGFGGESGRLTDQEFSVVTESIRSMAESTDSSALSAVPTDRTIHTHGTHHGPVGGQERVREDNLLSSMHYFPAARHVDAHRLSQLPTTGMQVVHELIHIWREEEGEYYSHGGGTWPGAAAQMGEPGSAQRKAEDDFFQEYAGEKKEDRYERKKAEATDGNVHSQMWMGKKIFSDNNGNDGIVSKARIWFEKAAAQNDPEANYIVGVLSVNNLGGLRRDFSKEVGLFLKAAHATEPFPMAWHALGDLHNGMPHSKDNIDADRLKAVEYYSRAAEYDFHESHFQLALMYKEGSKFIPVNIPRTVVHLTLAASLGSTKALSYLAHAFYDQNSWVMKYAREMAANQLDQHTRSYIHTEPTESQYSRRPIEKDYITSVYESFTSGEWTSMFQGTGVEVAIRLRDQLHRLGTFLFQEFMGPDPPPPSRFLAQHIMHDAALSARIRHGWVYNASTPLFVTLPGILSPILVPLPHPFWAPNSPPHHMFSARVRDSPSLKDCNSCRGPDSSSENTENTCQCDIGEKKKEEEKVYANDVTAAEFSMALLKHTVELSDSPMDLMDAAIVHLDKGNTWDALDLYEEAADMGSQLAEDNAIFLYDMLLLSDCSSDGRSAESRAKTHSKPMSRTASRKPSATPFTATFKGSHGQKDDPSSSKQYVLSGNSAVHEAEAARCRIYLNRMADMRLANLANGGNHYAAGILADNILHRISSKNSYSSVRTNLYPKGSTLSTYISKLFSDVQHALLELIRYSTGVSQKTPGGCQGDECLLSGAERSTELGELPDVKEAARLFAIAASHGDVRCLMSLGWLFTAPNGGIAMNLTVAKAIFLDAWQWESYLPSLFSPFTPHVKTPMDHPVKEFKHFSSFLSMDTFLYRENTLGVAPFFALTYLRIISYLHGPGPDPLEGPSPAVTTIDYLLQEISNLSQRLTAKLSSMLVFLQGYLSESDKNSLQALCATFLVLLLTLALRLYGRRRRH